MIFVTVGTQDNHFVRLLKSVDELIYKCNIKEEVIAQIGCTKYTPIGFNAVDFISEVRFKELVLKSNLIISHAGSGALFNGIKLNKKIIAVARLKKYGEMINDHQLELVNKLSKEGYIIDGTYSLIEAYKKSKDFVPRINDFENSIIEDLDKYLKSVLRP